MREPRTGELDRRITIKAWQDMPAMGTGIDQTFDEGVKVWGKIEPVGNAIFYGTKQVGEDVTDRIIIRRSATLTELSITGDHVCECKGLRYRVKRASAMNGGRNFVLLEVECLG